MCRLIHTVKPVSAVTKYGKLSWIIVSRCSWADIVPYEIGLLCSVMHHSITGLLWLCTILVENQISFVWNWNYCFKMTEVWIWHLCGGGDDEGRCAAICYSVSRKMDAFHFDGIWILLGYVTSGYSMLCMRAGLNRQILAPIRQNWNCGLVLFLLDIIRCFNGWCWRITSGSSSSS